MNGFLWVKKEGKITKKYWERISQKNFQVCQKNVNWSIFILCTVNFFQTWILERRLCQRWLKDVWCKQRERERRERMDERGNTDYILSVQVVQSGRWVSDTMIYIFIHNPHSQIHGQSLWKGSIHEDVNRVWETSWKKYTTKEEERSSQRFKEFLKNDSWFTLVSLTRFASFTTQWDIESNLSRKKTFF